MHGLMDYLMVLVLFASPWLFGFANADMSRWPPIVIGFVLLFTSLCTAYELGFTRIIPMRTHLIADFLAGLVLAASPWLFGFDHYVYLPHVILGVAELGAALITKTTPGSMGRREVGHSRPMDPIGAR